MLRLILAKAAIGRYEAGEHRCDQFSRLDRPLRCLVRKNFRIGDEIAVKRRRRLNCEPNRLFVLDRAELEFRHPSRFSPIGLEHQVPVDDDPDREAGSDRDRRLDIERAPDDLLSDLAAGPVYREVRDGAEQARIGYSAHWREDNQNPALASFLKVLGERYPLPTADV